MTSKLLIELVHYRSHVARVVLIAVMLLGGPMGCRVTDHGNPSPSASVINGIDPASDSPAVRDEASISPVSFEQPTASARALTSAGSPSIGLPAHPPRVEDFEHLPRLPMSLDTAVKIALDNSVIINDLGGRILTMPESISSTLDPAIVITDPRIGVDAALSAYDTQLEAGLTYNGNGNLVNSAFSSGQFGVFAQPETLAKVGLGRVLSTGTKVSLGGVGGYDQQLAGGVFAALGGEIRHPLMRGNGKQFNQIAGPSGRPGLYSGILIAQAKQSQSRLALEKAVGDLVRDVATTYWRLHHAYLNVSTKQTALNNATEIWNRQQQRVEAAASPADLGALALERVCSAEAALAAAVCGEKHSNFGVYSTELQLRTLLGLPTADGHLIVPNAEPLRVEMRFDWLDTVSVARSNRVELRRQADIIRQRELEVRAACNLQRTQVDLLGAFRKLGDDPDASSELFDQALDGWQVGIEVRRSVSNRLEKSAVRNARLQHSREIAILQAQQQRIDAELQTAITELDRAWKMIQSLSVAETAASQRYQAQSERHQAGDDEIEEVLQAQTRLTEVSTRLHHAIIDYNLAFIELHHARGTLLPMIGVGMAKGTADECRFAQQTASVYSDTSADGWMR